MRFLIAAAIILAAPASATQTEAGWRITFTRDTFTGEMAPIASTTDTSAAVRVSCDGADLAPRIETWVLDGDVVEFRTSGTRATFTFHAFAPSDPDAFLAMFAEAGGEPVAYRTEKRQGVLPSIGASQALAIMRDICSE